MDLTRLVLTTGQAARCCFVSPDTIVNWIKAGRLTARRTVGGQYRIMLEDLHAFMQAEGMSPQEDPDASDQRPMCWQFHTQADAGKPGPSPCADCMAKHLGVRDCFKLMGLRPQSGRAHGNCEECAYFQRWAKSGPSQQEVNDGR